MNVQIKEITTPEIGSVFSGQAYFDWGWKNMGFGQLSFHVNQDTGKVYIGNECMNRETVRSILHAFADYVADNGIMEDE